MAKRDNPSIRYTFLSFKDLEEIDRGKYAEPSWTCTKDMILHSISVGAINDIYKFKHPTKKIGYCFCVGGYNTQTKTWHSFVVYDTKGCIKKGNLYTIMDFFDIDSTNNYYDVSNIDEKPELFLDIYKANVLVNTKQFAKGLTTQELADYTLDEALNGSEWAKNVLKKPDNPIKIVCKREGITRPQLARKIGVKLTLLENYVSRGTCSAWLIATLREYYIYI